MFGLTRESVKSSNFVYNSFNILTIFIAPFESAFAAQYTENPTIPENNNVTLSNRFAGTGRRCLNSVATLIGRTE